jgi:hypothetical protein
MPGLQSSRGQARSGIQFQVFHRFYQKGRPFWLRVKSVLPEFCALKPLPLYQFLLPFFIVSPLCSPVDGLMVWQSHISQKPDWFF